MRDPRQNHQHGDTHPSATQSRFIHESWCTGEDSNLRSPLGAADLQSAAINHSATCAHPAEQKPPAGTANLLSQRCQRAIAKRPATRPAKLRNRRAIATSARNQLTRKLLLGSVLLESSASCLACFCCYASRRAQGLQFWSWRRDLNPRPSDYKSDALPAELRQRAASFEAHAPNKHSSPCPLGQTLRITQATSPLQPDFQSA